MHLPSRTKRPVGRDGDHSVHLETDHAAPLFWKELRKGLLSSAVPIGELPVGNTAATFVPCYGVRPHVKPDRRQRLSSRCLRKVEDYVRDNLANPAVRLTLATLARAAQLSPFHFHRLFRDRTGMTPHEFVIQQRIERAQRLLLASPKKSVAKVAAEVGCADQSHLCRLFKRRLGVTPATFRKSAR